MRVTTYQGEKSLETLVRKLYQLDQPGTDLARAVDAVVAANPNLPLRQPGTLSKAIPKDTVIVVPDLEGATPTDNTQPVDVVTGQGILARMKDILDVLQPEFDAANERSTSELKETLDLIGSNLFLAAAKKDPNLAATLRSVSDNSRAGLDDVAADAQDPATCAGRCAGRNRGSRRSRQRWPSADTDARAGTRARARAGTCARAVDHTRAQAVAQTRTRIRPETRARIDAASRCGRLRRGTRAAPVVHRPDGWLRSR